MYYYRYNEECRKSAYSNGDLKATMMKWAIDMAMMEIRKRERTRKRKLLHKWLCSSINIKSLPKNQLRPSNSIGIRIQLWLFARRKASKVRKWGGYTAMSIVPSQIHTSGSSSSNAKFERRKKMMKKHTVQYTLEALIHI